jgi:hypothetical protein
MFSARWALEEGRALPLALADFAGFVDEQPSALLFDLST